MNLLYPQGDYRNFFNFSLVQPVAKTKWMTMKLVKENLYDQGLIPITVITDMRHPIFASILPQFPIEIARDIDAVFLSIRPLIQYSA